MKYCSLDHMSLKMFSRRERAVFAMLWSVSVYAPTEVRHLANITAFLANTSECC
jgi:hypothetical protein